MQEAPAAITFGVIFLQILPMLNAFYKKMWYNNHHTAIIHIQARQLGGSFAKVSKGKQSRKEREYEKDIACYYIVALMRLQ